MRDSSSGKQFFCILGNPKQVYWDTVSLENFFSWDWETLPLGNSSFGKHFSREKVVLRDSAFGKDVYWETVLLGNSSFEKQLSWETVLLQCDLKIV